MRPLDGLIVLDLTRVLSGPYCTMMLADMGARVIKIERPGSGDDTRAWGPPFIGGESSYFLSVNRNKESVAIDFKHPDGRRLLDALIAKADVLVENFAPGTLDALGLGYASVASRHPRLVYASITGFGLTGPRREQPGYDAMIQAESGLMSLTGSKDGDPYRLGVAIADIIAGMFAAQGITMALLVRERTGKGQQVDIGMLDAATALLTYQAGIYFTTGQTPSRTGNRHPSIAPYDTFPTEDGALVLAVGNDRQWQTFCRVIGHPSLANDARFETNPERVAHYDSLRPVLIKALRTRSRQEWIDHLVPAGVPCAAVRALDEVLTDPQIMARGMIEVLQHPSAGALRVLGIPVKLSDTPGAVQTPPPRLGEHTASVLRDLLDVPTEEVSRLVRDHAVGVAADGG